MRLLLTLLLLTAGVWGQAESHDKVMRDLARFDRERTERIGKEHKWLRSELTRMRKATCQPWEKLSVWGAPPTETWACVLREGIVLGPTITTPGELDDRIAALEKRVAELEERLKKLMAPSEPIAIYDCRKPEGTVSLGGARAIQCKSVPPKPRWTCSLDSGCCRQEEKP